MELRLQTDIKHSALWMLMLQMQLKKIFMRVQKINLCCILHHIIVYRKDGVICHNKPDVIFLYFLSFQQHSVAYVTKGDPAGQTRGDTTLWLWRRKFSFSSINAMEALILLVFWAPTPPKKNLIFYQNVIVLVQVVQLQRVYAYSDWLTTLYPCLDWFLNKDQMYCVTSDVVTSRSCCWMLGNWS